MTERDHASLLDIIRFADTIGRFADEVGQEGFLVVDSLEQSALLHQLLILGEATSRLSSELREAYPDVDWRGAKGQRNRMIHGYDSLSYEQIWRTITDVVPVYRDQIQRILDAETSA